jgi:glycosyltransferase involved in cell wall biosynthesis
MIIYHCKAKTGYAIETLERTFWETAKTITGNVEDIHLCYKSYSSGYPNYTPLGFNNFYQLDPTESDTKKLVEFQKYIKNHGITIIFGFDQPPNLSYYRYARNGGVSRIISYYGAPMSSLNSGIRLMLKRLQVKLYRYIPDLFIFESRAMQETAYNGRGIPKEKTAVCHLGIDTTKFIPDERDRFYAHDMLNLDKDQKLIFYSGHFEPRKGISVIIEAANSILEERSDVTFILFGNQQGEEKEFAEKLNEAAEKHVIFGGYRKDLNRMHRACYAGVIASTGWDSFTVSSLEMQASGLPLLVSDLDGLNEAIDQHRTGSLFNPGDSNELKNLLVNLLDNPDKRNSMSHSARQHIEQHFSLEKQVSRLKSLVQGHQETLD